MSLQIGYLDDNGHPRLTIRVTGTTANAQCDVDALIDTGFSGFLMLPIALALPLGLVLLAAGDYQLADGSVVTPFLARGFVAILSPSTTPATQSVGGSVVLAGDGAILGMEFLRSLVKWLLVGRAVALIDDADLPASLLKVN